MNIKMYQKNYFIFHDFSNKAKWSQTIPLYVKTAFETFEIDVLKINEMLSIFLIELFLQVFFHKVIMQYLLLLVILN